MLTNLRIENFTIVKELDLDFSKGMTAFTGETGAGKSIMIDALMLALGGRADARVIRPGSEKCEVSASFQFDNQAEPAQWLKEQDLDSEEGVLILRRVLYTEGRTKSYINGQPFPLQKLKELAELLVHIHGQHQHQTLMQHTTHRQQLDNYAGLQEELLALNALYRQCLSTQQAMEALRKKDKQKDKIELLNFQISELKALNLCDNELQELHAEHQLLHHAKDYLEQCQQLSQLLNGEDEASVCRGLNQSLQILNHLPQEQTALKNSFELLTSALIQCEEAVDELEQFREAVHLDPKRLQEVEERLSLLHQTARKYQTDARHLPEHLLNLEHELNALEATDLKLNELEKAYQQELKAYEQAALKLRASRQIHAEKLAQEITDSIRQLGMPKGRVEIELSPLEKMQAHGLDRVEYKVCTNPGMAMDSLAKIASGGELSRLSLAIQMITAQRGSTPTLLFDEVDVGIGGVTAALVGQLLRKLGERLQVFCVTHQPQVASSAHNHFVVEKQSDNEQTYSTILALSARERIDEIARMLGGLTITAQTRSHAKELLEQTEDFANA